MGGQVALEDDKDIDSLEPAETCWVSEIENRGLRGEGESGEEEGRRAGEVEVMAGGAAGDACRKDPTHMTNATRQATATTHFVPAIASHHRHVQRASCPPPHRVRCVLTSACSMVFLAPLRPPATAPSSRSRRSSSRLRNTTTWLPK